MPAYSEADFEDAIEAWLIEHGGYDKRDASAFDESQALFADDVIGFIQDTQPQRWEALHKLLGDNARNTVLDSLGNELRDKGTLHVLRHGFKCYGKLLRLAYFRPNTGLNPETERLYAYNRLTITRQVAFASVMKQPGGGNKRCVVDVVLAVNGLPVVTVELKNPLTGQHAADAVKQYQQERDGRDLLFAFKTRALVHFAVDPDEAWMTTRLAGAETRFFPFNKGHAHGAGNPPAAGNWKTHYLWDEVLERHSLLDILQRFIHLEVEQRKIQTDKGPRTVRKEQLIFPRYHQLDAVRRLIGHAREHGSGHNYLVQHSAGSGKSNSIAWLAHRLAGLHDPQDDKIFHSVVVVTDRRVLDSQLQETIYQFEHKRGVVEKIDENTRQLARALSTGTPIIITTIQKFPFIAQALSTLEQHGESIEIDTAGKRFAVIVDEAHSSQSGETAKTLRVMLNRDGIEAAVAAQLSDADGDELSTQASRASLREAMRRARQPNLSFFAFTATPKYKTLALFDEPGPSGDAPFHEYSMRQAIEEGFIMDVLANYTTYKRFYGLIKQVEEDPEVPRRKAARTLAQYMELHPVNIDQIISVIIEHFRLHVMPEMCGRAKAMVVTASRLAAVKYKLAFDAYLLQRGYTGIRSLVAFSGTVEDPEDPGSAWTEVGMNDGLAESELPETFAKDDYRVLLVAEKYQTGFDQPLLQTMYIVKQLSGVQAVQTLSRLNRVAPGKVRTFVLDFVNAADDIYQAFKPYYESTLKDEDTDPQRLNQLQHQLLEWRLFTPDDIRRYAEVWYKKKRNQSATDHQQLNAIVDQVVERFLEYDEDERELFRGQLTAFRSVYAFLSQIIPYQDSDLERFYTFVRGVLAKLPARSNGRTFKLDDEVALKYYRLQQISDGSIDLDSGTAYPLKGLSEVGTAGIKDEAVALSSLVDKLNERFGTDFAEGDQLFFDQIQASAEQDEEIIEAARANNYNDFEAWFGKKLEDLFIERMDDNKELFNRVMADETFRSIAQEYLADGVFRAARNADELTHGTK